MRTGNFDASVTTSNGANRTGTLKRTFSLVLLSVVLPNQSNFRVYHAVHTAGSVPVLVMSTQRRSVSGVHNLNLNTSSCVIGPFDPGRLMTQIGNRLTQCRRLASHRARHSILHCKSLRVSRDNRHIFIGKGRITLPGGRFRLLLFFTGGPSVIFDGRALFSHI